MPTATPTSASPKSTGRSTSSARASLEKALDMQPQQRTGFLLSCAGGKTLGPIPMPKLPICKWLWNSIHNHAMRAASSEFPIISSINMMNQLSNSKLCRRSIPMTVAAHYNLSHPLPPHGPEGKGCRTGRLVRRPTSKSIPEPRLIARFPPQASRNLDRKRPLAHA